MLTFHSDDKELTQNVIRICVAFWEQLLYLKRLNEILKTLVPEQ